MADGSPLVLVVAGVMPGAADGEVFAFRRAVGEREAGCWEFPGGKIEPDESPEEALVRELDEELGITVSVGRRLWAGSEGGIEVTYYKVERGDQIPELRVHDEMTSMLVNAPPALPWATVDGHFVSRLQAIYAEENPRG